MVLYEGLIGLAGAVGAAYIWERWIRDRVTVRRIMSNSHKDTEGLIEFYSYLFQEDGTNYSPEEIIDFVETDHGEFHVRLEDIVLVARYHGDVVGFIFCHFYPERKKAIISYFGINKQVMEARRSAAAMLLRKLMRILTDRNHSCEFLFFDLKKPDRSLSPEENSERGARPVLFKRSAAGLGFKALRLEFEYKCPRLSLSDGTREEPLTLMFVPMATGIVSPIPRSLVLEFLRFVYLDCYGTLYRRSDPRWRVHHQYLAEIIDRYERSLPEEIACS